MSPPIRVSEYNEAIADAICEALIEGRSLRSICRDDDMPSASTVCKWLTQQPAFAEHYARAREAQADTLADETTDIADTPLIGVETVTKADGSKEVREGDMLGHRKLQVDTRKWFASKLAPKKYGDRQIIAGDKDAPLAIESTSDLERAKAVAALVASTQRKAE